MLNFSVRNCLSLDDEGDAGWWRADRRQETCLLRHWADRPGYIREEVEGRDPDELLTQLLSASMPGHVKKTSGPDPDPSPWLCVSDALKAKNKNKPYDAKKSVWVGIYQINQMRERNG